ncbi:peptidylprolyl isomerase SurA [Psychrosphaera sp. F3M07]|jgi:peptidyl-prolyl cis-trans isomerase SurA|uniref:peptidylprolyl isomerase SurA n=1 Tax=Psychrosphaera sp. F3M07 TaxID=2841560 RepID=UPI001C082F5E|nr:peptidylprolyl isomerase SurA [Psychrosphaera sp. F3M07]MBU2917834.1 peptidylprolyl isomerase SurA [Psychrosphaera sp. F3M07]
MINKSIISLTLLCSLFVSAAIQAEPKPIDHVTVIVNDGVILEGEIQAIIDEVKSTALLNNQSLPSDRALRAQAVDRLILNSIQMQMAERMGIQVSDAHLDSVLQNIAQSQNISVEQMRQEIVKSGESYERYREKLREEVALNEVRRGNVHRRVNISLQEVTTLIGLMDENSSKEEYQIGHILVSVPSKAAQSEVDAKKDIADKVISLLKDGSDFKKVAIASSSGAKALEGGDWGYMGINEMPSLFSESVRGKKTGDLIGPLRSGAGFHIVKILDIRGRQTVEVKEVLARHILITPSIILSEEKAKNMLNKFLAQVEDGSADFGKLAKQHSEDPGSALKNGELGWANPDIYAPKFKEVLANLKVGEYSKPFRTQFGWHVVQLMEERTADATEKSKQDQAYQILYKRKFAEETENWLREIRDQAFIEVIAE